MDLLELLVIGRVWFDGVLLLDDWLLLPPRPFNSCRPSLFSQIFMNVFCLYDASTNPFRLPLLICLLINSCVWVCVSEVSLFSFFFLLRVRGRTQTISLCGRDIYNTLRYLLIIPFLPYLYQTTNIPVLVSFSNLLSLPSLLIPFLHYLWTSEVLRC